MHTEPDPHADKAVADGTSDTYNSSVLVGNWYENRFSDKTDRRAITPCIYGVSTCYLGNTVYSDNYKAPVEKHSPVGILEFMESRHLAFENRMKSYESNVKIFDSESFVRNMTTMKDIMFRIKPEEARNYGEFDILKPRLKENLLKGYGNVTKTGLNAWMKCEANRDARQRLDISTYKETFVPKPLPKKC